MLLTVGQAHNEETGAGANFRRGPGYDVTRQRAAGGEGLVWGGAALQRGNPREQPRVPGDFATPGYTTVRQTGYNDLLLR